MLAIEIGNRTRPGTKVLLGYRWAMLNPVTPGSGSVAVAAGEPSPHDRGHQRRARSGEEVAARQRHDRSLWTTTYHAAMSKPLGPYTPVVRAGDWIIVSGQLGMVDGALVAGGVAAQTTQAVENLKSQLAGVGASLSDIAKTLCFLTDMDTFATFNEAYIAGFGDHRPARSTIGVAALPAGGAVEIEAWAFKPVA